MLHKIACYSPEEGDGCAFYRGSGVLSELFRHDIAVMRCPPRISWPDFSDCSVAFMQRPFNDLHIQVAKMLKSQLPLWIDYDDDLSSVPDTNPVHAVYSSPSLLANLTTLWKMADVITVSTPALAAKIPCAIVIPNAYNDYRLNCSFSPPQQKRKTRVLWRGTESHQGDLKAFAPQLDRLIKTLPEVDFIFAGFYPWMLENRNKPNVTFLQKRDIFQYFQMLEQISPDVVIVPLEDNALNRAKSNIAHLETARFGSITVAPDWPEWKLPGVVNYNKPNDMAAAVRSLVTSPLPVTKDAWNYVGRNLFLSSVNLERLGIYKGLVS